MHPFVHAMVDVLVGAGKRSKRPAFAPGYFYRAADKKFEENVALMAKVATDLIHERRHNPTDKKDLLNAMLHNKDPKTGENLTEESIVNNMITFLIAGIHVLGKDVLNSRKLTILQATKQPQGCCPSSSTNF